MTLKRLLFLILVVVMAASCGSKKKVTSRKSSPRTENKRESRAIPARPVDAEVRSRPTGSYANIVEQYISEYSDIAMEEMRLYNIPASITLAQGILESGAGRGELTRRANNHFGIKCHDWEGDKVYHDDDRSQECFRKYNDPKFSYRDHSLFLSERRRYSNLFDLDIDDYEGWAKGLRAAGYATDRLYPRKLIDMIEKYQLNHFDEKVLGKKSRRRERSSEIAEASSNSGFKTYTVEKGDTLYSISKRFNTTVEMLQEVNNLRSNDLAIGQRLKVSPANNQY